MHRHEKILVNVRFWLGHELINRHSWQLVSARARPAPLTSSVSIVTTNARAPGGQFVLRAKAVPGRPYVGHTLRTAIEETQKLTGQVRWHGLARSNTSCRD